MTLLKMQNRLFYSALVTFLLKSTCVCFVASKEGCLYPLGIEDGRIKDSQLRAVSYRSILSAPKYARLNRNDGNGGWCPDQAPLGNKTGPFYSQFLQVKLGLPVRIKGIALQGRAGGVEKVKYYWINYRFSGTSHWIYDESGNVKSFKGNVDTKLQRSIIRPPIVADVIKIIPEIFPSKQVCMRFELLGCSFKNGLVSYTMPQGNEKGGRYNFTDSIYDGFTKENFLSSGLGFLSDGRLAPADYVDSNGLGWIGWNAKHTPAPYISFAFLDTRIFHSVTIHCNVRNRAMIKLFSDVTVSFSLDGVAFNTLLTHRPRNVTSGSLWMNYNATIDLCKHTGRLVMLNFTYAGEWILISEVTFKSDPLGYKSPPEAICGPAPNPAPSKMPPLYTGHLLTTRSLSNRSEGNNTTRSRKPSTSNLTTTILIPLAVIVLVISFVVCLILGYIRRRRNKDSADVGRTMRNETEHQESSLLNPANAARELGMSTAPGDRNDEGTNQHRAQVYTMEDGYTALNPRTMNTKDSCYALLVVSEEDYSVIGHPYESPTNVNEIPAAESPTYVNKVPEPTYVNKVPVPESPTYVDQNPAAEYEIMP